MAYPLEGSNFKKAFRFGQLYPDTAYFRKAGLAGKSHIGLDILCPIGTRGYAPCNGTSVYRESKTIGQACYFYGDNGKLYRFLHLSEQPVEGYVTEGQYLFSTGNSGASTAPHVHIDIHKSHTFSGKIEDMEDPEIHEWDSNKKVLVFVNNLIEPDDPYGKAFQDAARDAVLPPQVSLTTAGEYHIKLDIVSADRAGGYMYLADNPYGPKKYWGVVQVGPWTSKSITVKEALEHEIDHALAWETFQSDLHGDPRFASPNEETNHALVLELFKEHYNPSLHFLKRYKSEQQPMESLFRNKVTGDVYRITNGQKDLFINATSFGALDGRWSEIIDKDPEELEQYPNGHVLIAVPNE